MNDKIKEIIKSTVISIGIALTIFCIVGIVFDITLGGTFSLDEYRFTKMVVACVLVGLGFGVPTVVYNSERMPYPLKVIIHMGIGFAVYIPVAYYVGWFGSLSVFKSPLQIAVIVAVQIVTAFVIWFFFARYYRKEAKKMNEKIQSMKK
ncbi:MAG: DUF3021 domain-containing protein [Saccharofermentans sp.]|nr:DUF3021 domain-containing protein [Saccharofermentans sp.]